MAEQRNIVVLGASFAGLSAAHYILKHLLPQLQKANDVKYLLHLVDPSTHFWWHIAAPREIVSVKEMPHPRYFIDIMRTFKHYDQSLTEAVVFHHGTATALDVEQRLVSIKPHGATDDTEPESLPYHALVIATGVRSPTPLTTLQGDYTLSQKALDDMNTQLASAKEIVIGGGGPVGVETAGEIAAHLKGSASITLVAGGAKLLPKLGQKFSDKAQKLLEKYGVKVIFGAKVTGTELAADGKTTVSLDKGDSLASVDVYIPAWGVLPNTEFLPADLKTERGYVAANAQTLRVDAAGPRVYTVGDVAAVDQGGVLNLYASLPVMGANLRHDLLAEAKVDGVAVPPEKSYARKDVETQLVPIGPKAGVGAFNGFSMPGFVVSQVKGKDYMAGQIDKLVVSATQWKKA